MSDDIASGATFHLTGAGAAARIDEASAVRSIPLFRHGTLLIKYYAPRGVDPQTAHTRDETYVVARGHGMFFNGSSRRPFARPGTCSSPRPGRRTASRISRTTLACG